MGLRPAARKAAARQLLLEWLIRAKNTTRALGKTIPQLAAYVNLPDPVDDRMLLTVARQFAVAIAPHAEPFAAHGIAIEALDTLNVTVPNHLAGDAVTLAAWKNERRLTRSKTSAKAARPPREPQREYSRSPCGLFR